MSSDEVRGKDARVFMSTHPRERLDSQNRSFLHDHLRTRTPRVGIEQLQRLRRVPQKERLPRPFDEGHVGKERGVSSRRCCLQ
ncbi:MAG: hypothetical protein NVS3B20_25400 [Polyangiales bacterium]